MRACLCVCVCVCVVYRLMRRVWLCSNSVCVTCPRPTERMRCLSWPLSQASRQHRYVDTWTHIHAHTHTHAGTLIWSCVTVRNCVPWPCVYVCARVLRGLRFSAACVRMCACVCVSCTQAFQDSVNAMTPANIAELRHSLCHMGLDITHNPVV